MSTPEQFYQSKKHIKPEIKLDEWIGIGVLILLFLTVTLGVFGRYLLRTPLGWTEAVARYLFIWLVFLGSPALVLKKGFLRVDYFAELMLGSRILDWYRIAIDLFSALFVLGTFVYLGGQLIINTWGQKEATLDLPLSLIRLAIPLGGILIVARLLQAVKSRVNDIKGEITR